MFTFFIDGVLSPEKNQKAMKKMRISIENPCHEDWQGMTPEAQGRFCSACEKTVIDFSQMSDAEILQYFSQPRTEKVCGRFTSEQLSPSVEGAKQFSNDRNYGRGDLNRTFQPSKQLLHFAYLLVVVLGVGLSSCGESAVTGEVQGNAIVNDSSHQASPGEKSSEKIKAEETNPEKIESQKGNPKQGVQVVELMGDTIAYFEPDTTEDVAPVMGKPVVHQPKRPQIWDPSQYMTGPYEHTLTPANAVDTAQVVKPKADHRPQPPKYIKGKVALPKKTKPAEPIPEEKIQDVRIMGEGVVPYEYEKPKG